MWLAVDSLFPTRMCDCMKDCKRSIHAAEGSFYVLNGPDRQSYLSFSTCHTDMGNRVSLPKNSARSISLLIQAAGPYSFAFRWVA